MRGKEIITKLIIPGAIAMIICLIVHPMCMNCLLYTSDAADD